MDREMKFRKRFTEVAIDLKDNKEWFADIEVYRIVGDNQVFIEQLNIKKYLNL